MTEAKSIPKDPPSSKAADEIRDRLAKLEADLAKMKERWPEAFKEDK